MPEMTTEPTPWNTAWNRISDQGAWCNCVGKICKATNKANKGTKQTKANAVMAMVARTASKPWLRTSTL